jgi:sec-independent protein translocase protein TatB
MFDIGFWELGIIAVVALLVIGPEQLPGVARTVGKWVGTAKRFVSTVQNDINAEVNKAEELKRLLEEQSKIKSVHEILETKKTDENDRKPVPRENNEPVEEITSADTGNEKSGESSIVDSPTPEKNQNND